MGIKTVKGFFELFTFNCPGCEVLYQMKTIEVDTD